MGIFRSLQYAVYKGVTGKHGAVQFNFQPPHYYRNNNGVLEKDFSGKRALLSNGNLGEDWKIREGAVFMDATSAVGENTYDWDQKITIALSVGDMGKLALALRIGEKLELVHDPGAKTDRQGAVRKYITFDSPKGVQAGGFLSVRQVSGGNTRSHLIPLKPDECLILQSLLLSALPRALGWST